MSARPASFGLRIAITLPIAAIPAAPVAGDGRGDLGVDLGVGELRGM